MLVSSTWDEGVRLRIDAVDSEFPKSAVNYVNPLAYSFEKITFSKRLVIHSYSSFQLQRNTKSAIFLWISSSTEASIQHAFEWNSSILESPPS